MNSNENKGSNPFDPLIPKYPLFLQQNIEKEAEELYNEIQSQILTNPPDLLEKIVWEIPYKARILRKRYKISQEQREFIVSVFLNYIFDKPTSIFEKNAILRALNSTIGRKKVKNLRLNWRKVYHFLEEVFFPTHVDFILGRARNSNCFEKFLEFLSKVRWLYEESHLEELFLIVRQNISVSEPARVKALALLLCFFTAHKDYSSGYYEKYLPELFEYWSWRINPSYDKIFFDLIARLATNHVEIDWKPYYEIIFQNLLRLITSTFPNKGPILHPIAMEASDKVNLMIQYNAGKGSDINAHLWLPFCVKPGDKLFWTNMERIVNVCMVYCHPENQGRWTQIIALFFSKFARNYIKRYFKEKKKEEEDPLVNKEFHLDEECHKSFMTLMKRLLNFLLFSRLESMAYVSKLVQTLIYFRPEEIAPFLFEKVNYAFTLPEFSIMGMALLLGYTAHPMLWRQNYNKGLYELPNLLFQALDHITSSDRQKTIFVLFFYAKVCELVPIFDPEDLEAQLKKLQLEPNLEIFNENEEINFPLFIDQLSNWALDFFTKFVQILPFLDEKKIKDIPSARGLVIDPANYFAAFVSGSSHSLQKRYLEIFANYLLENVEKTLNLYVSWIIQAFNLADPELTLKYLFPVFKEKLLAKRHVPFQAKNSIQNYLLENSKHAAHIKEYELKALHKENLIWYLAILKDLVKFTRGYTLDYENDIETILIHSIGHSEIEVCEAAAEVVQMLLLSLVSVYPKNVSCMNRNQWQEAANLKDVYRTIGKPAKEGVDPDWYQSTFKEIEYAVYFANLFKDSIIQGLSQDYLANVSGIWSEDLSTLIDIMNLNLQETTYQKKQDITRGTLLIYSVFQALCQRASYKDIYELSSTTKEFEDNFFIKEFDDYRLAIIVFANKMVYWCIHNGYSHDEKIMRHLCKMLASAVGEDEQ